MKLKIFFLCSCLVFAFSCGGGSSEQAPQSAEMTKSMLKLRGFEFTEDGFFDAIRQNDTVAIKGFFEAGMNPNARNRVGETALTYAVSNSELKTVKAVAEKADINLQDGLGQSPIHLALSKQKQPVFDFLLEKGADVNVGGSKDKTRNQTVLYLAVARENEDLIQKLLEKDADPNLADSEKAVPLGEACVRTRANPNIVKMLIDKGASVNHQENNGATPLIYIAANKGASSENRVAIAKMLLDAGADKKLKDKDGRTALDWANKQGNKDAAELLK